MFGSAVFRLALPKNAIAIALPPRRLRTVARIAQVAAALAAASGLGWVALTVVNMTGGLEDLDVGTLRAFFLETDFGSIEITRLVLLLLLVGAAVWPLAPGRRIAMLGAASGVLLISQAWLGHAAEGGSTWRGAAMLAAYAVHVLAGAVWVGGLVPLLVAVRTLTGRGERPALVAVLARVSTIATTAVVLIVASGVVNTAFRVGGDLALLWSTPYGRVLGVKLGLVALMLVFAAYNRIIALPRLRSAADGAAQTAGGGLPVSLGLELTAGVLVLAAAAVLGITPPPR